MSTRINLSSIGLVKMMHLKQLSLILLVCFSTSLHSLPLSTNYRWIINTQTGDRVKLKCVNWAGHMEVMVPEGLDRQPLDDIAAKVASLGFNCVRLTWATYMYTKSSQVKVAQSFESLKLLAAIDGIKKHNPNILNMTLVNVQSAVVDSLGGKGIMVVLDNHVSKPMWCCSDTDGNGFFGDQHFDPREWLEGLNLTATRYKGKRQVVGISLRNELRGPRQNEKVWHQYMQEAATAIHKTNPELLVVVSGLSYDTNLEFVTNPSLQINLPNNKLVYEIHRYSMTGGGRPKWLNNPLNQVCGNLKTQFEKQGGFLVNSSKPMPLFVGEFGIDQRGENEADNRFLSCFTSILVEKDMDWGLWALQGSYYLRKGNAGFEETYAVLDANWSTTRDHSFKAHYGILQSTLQEVEKNCPTQYILYHLKSGACARAEKGVIHIDDCTKRSIWNYDERDGRIRLMGTSSCIKMAGEGEGEGEGVIVSEDCSSWSTIWSFLSNSKLHIGGRIWPDAKQQCMDWNATTSGATIVSKDCVCIDDKDAKCLQDPRTQWFQLIPSSLK